MLRAVHSSVSKSALFVSLFSTYVEVLSLTVRVNQFVIVSAINQLGSSSCRFPTRLGCPTREGRLHHLLV